MDLNMPYGSTGSVASTKGNLNKPIPKDNQRGDLFPIFVGIANVIGGFFSNITGVMSFHQKRHASDESEISNDRTCRKDDQPRFTFEDSFKVNRQDGLEVAERALPLRTLLDNFRNSPMDVKVDITSGIFYDSDPKDSGFDDIDYSDASPPIDEVDSISSFSRWDDAKNSAQAIKNKTQVRLAQCAFGTGRTNASFDNRDLPEMDAAEQCRGKISQLQDLLAKKCSDVQRSSTKSSMRFRSRPKKIFVDAKSVNTEECEGFESERLVSMAGSTATAFVNPGRIAESELIQVETPINKIEVTNENCVSSVSEPLLALSSSTDIKTKVTDFEIKNMTAEQNQCLNQQHTRLQSDQSTVNGPQINEQTSKETIQENLPDPSLNITESMDIVRDVVSERNDVKRISNEPAVGIVSADKNINLEHPTHVSKNNTTSVQICDSKLETDVTENIAHTVDASKTSSSLENNCSIKHEGADDSESAVELLQKDNQEKKAEIIANCEDKVNKLKALLSERKKKNREALKIKWQEEEMRKMDRQRIETRKSPEKSIPIVNGTRNKHRKNPNRLDTHEPRRKEIKRNINEDMCFARDLDSDQSLENSPKILITPPDLNGFDEIRGRFHSGSESDDSFIIVFSDSPKSSPVLTQRARLPSDCGSEDSFVICFEDDQNCYASNEVFSSSDDEIESDSDVKSNLLRHSSFSRTVSDLTDESLYTEDTVLGASASDSDDVEEERGKSTGLLLTEEKKMARRGQHEKKVRFSDKPPKVHVMRVWTFAARQARSGHWDKVVADRDRFKRRIADVDMAISWVLKPQHRSRVKFQRFMPWWNKLRRLEIAERKLREADDKLRKIETDARMLELQEEVTLRDDYEKAVEEYNMALIEKCDDNSVDVNVECVEDNVISDSHDGNIGSIVGENVKAVDDIVKSDDRAGNIASIVGDDVIAVEDLVNNNQRDGIVDDVTNNRLSIADLNGESKNDCNNLTKYYGNICAINCSSSVKTDEKSSELSVVSNNIGKSNAMANEKVFNVNGIDSSALNLHVVNDAFVNGTMADSINVAPSGGDGSVNNNFNYHRKKIIKNIETVDMKNVLRNAASGLKTVHVNKKIKKVDVKVCPVPFTLKR